MKIWAILLAIYYILSWCAIIAIFDSTGGFSNPGNRKLKPILTVLSGLIFGFIIYFIWFGLPSFFQNLFNTNGKKKS